MCFSWVHLFLRSSLKTVSGALIGEILNGNPGDLLVKMCICAWYFYLNLKKHTWNNDTERPPSAYGLTQKSPVCILQAGDPGKLQWVYLRILKPFRCRNMPMCVSFTFYIIEKSINRWRLPGEEPVRGFSQENMFEPGDFISLSHMTWLLNKITVSTPKGSHCARCVCECECLCVCVCEPHLVGMACVEYLSGVSMFFSRGGGVFGVQRKDQDPLPPHPHSSFLP